MNRFSHLDRPRPYRGRVDRCDPPIVWPQRPSPWLANFPGISISWPMPMIVPTMLGGWGSMRWSSGDPDYADRRPAMNRYCEPRRYDRCCERCGCYGCRCERERCDDCGCYECRCEPARCDACGYYECRCKRSRPVEIIVLPDEKFEHNSALVDHENKYLPASAYPRVGLFHGAKAENTIPAAVVNSTPSKVTITIKLPDETRVDTYTAVILDAGGENSVIPSVLGYLTLVVYPKS